MNVPLEQEISEVLASDELIQITLACEVQLEIEAHRRNGIRIGHA